MLELYIQVFTEYATGYIRLPTCLHTQIVTNSINKTTPKLTKRLFWKMDISSTPFITLGHT